MDNPEISVYLYLAKEYINGYRCGFYDFYETVAILNYHKQLLTDLSYIERDQTKADFIDEQVIWYLADTLA